MHRVRAAQVPAVRGKPRQQRRFVAQAALVAVLEAEASAAPAVLETSVRCSSGCQL